MKEAILMTQTIRKPKLMRLATFITALALMFTFFGVMPEGALRVSADSTYTYTDSNGTWSYVLKSDGTARLKGLEKSSSFSGSLVIPSAVNGNTVTEMNMTFQGDTSVKSVVMPDTLTDISYLSAFENCTSLKEVTFSKSLKLIRARTFMGCTSLTTLKNFSNNGSITKIEFAAFCDCTSLEYVTLPYNLTSLPEYQVLKSCTSLKGIVFPEGLKSIPYLTATYCKNLEYVYVPSSVTSIAANAFYLGRYYDDTLKENVDKYVPKIYGYSGTAAEEYANEHGAKFVALDSYVSAMKYTVKATDCTFKNPDTNITATSAANITEGTKLKLTPNAPETGKVFDHWQVRYTINCIKSDRSSGTSISTKTCEYFSTTDNPITVTASPDGKQWIAQMKADSTVPITVFSGRVIIRPVYVDKTYKLTLVGCKASKTEGINAGESITITPNTPEEGYRFSYWKASTGEALSGNASKLVYTMPAQDVTITAVFEKRPTYKITTADCTAYLGSTDTVITEAEENQTVRLVAAQPPQGYGFVEWAASNSSVKFYSADSKSAFFAMPPVNVTVYPVFAPLPKHKTTVTVTNYGSAGDYADVTVNEGYMGDTATVKIAFKNGTYSINKISAHYINGSMTPPVPLTKVGDTTYTFTYPDYDVELIIRVNVMRVNDDPLDITVSDTLSDDFEGDKVRYNELLAFVEYFKSTGKASYTVSGGKYYVDLDKNGSNDIIINSSDMTVSKASTSSLPKIFSYTADEAAVKFMTDYLAKNDIWILRKELSIITKPTINAKSLGTQVIDLTSGSYQMTKEKDMSLMAALQLLANEGLIGMDEKTSGLDLDNDGTFDIKIVMNETSATISVLKPIGDSYMLALNDTMKSRVKAMIEGVGLTEYYDGFRFVFKKGAGKPGDANDDGEVDVQDVLLIQQYIAGWKVKINLKNANVNGDTEADIQDCLLIQQHIAGWSVTLG